MNSAAKDCMALEALPVFHRSTLDLLQEACSAYSHTVPRPQSTGAYFPFFVLGGLGSLILFCFKI